MTHSIDQLRRDAKALKKAFEAGDEGARQRMASIAKHGAPKHADYLHAVAREAGFASWPALKLAAELRGLDVAAKQARLRRALFLGEAEVISQLLADTPDLAEGDVPLLVALYDVDGMRKVLAADPGAATRVFAPRRPMCHLAFSRYHTVRPDLSDAMIAMADLLVAHGADVNDHWLWPEDNAPLSALYGAVGHGDNMGLAAWLLDHGADPNDGESLYHATELGHHVGLKLLLAHGAVPQGTNALLRAMDFDDAEAVALLLEAGADPNEAMGGVTALHQAARRMCSGEIAQRLLDAGGDPRAVYQGHTPYALARIYGNGAIAKVLEAANAVTPLSQIEAQLARAADGTQGPQDWIDMAKLSDEARFLLCRLVWREGTLPHIARLIEMGFDPNQPDEQGMPPLHLAGWEGLLEKTRFFLRQGPDLGHLNGYGGTLFSTILHGSENCPQRDSRDHVGCMKLILELGVALPKKALERASQPEMVAFLRDWARAHPGQVVLHGVV